MGRALLPLLLAPALVGCSLVWGPGPPIPPLDVGVDAGVDFGPFDAGVDFGPPDSGLCVPTAPRRGMHRGRHDR